MDPHELAVEVAARVHEAVGPQLVALEASVAAGNAPDAVALRAVDDLAESTVRARLEADGDIAFFSKAQGLVRFGEPRALLVVDPVDGSRPPTAGLEARCISIAVVPPDETATFGQVSFGLVLELITGQRFRATRGAGVRAEEADGTSIPIARSESTELEALFWTAGLRGRPSLPMTIVLEELVDRSGQRGGYFDLDSAAFNITRIVTGGLGAYVDVGLRLVDEFPEMEPAFVAAGQGEVRASFPDDVAAAALILEEAGGVITHADGRSLADHPVVGSSRAEALAVIAAASPALHTGLVDVVDRGITHLGSWFSAARGQ